MTDQEKKAWEDFVDRAKRKDGDFIMGHPVSVAPYLEGILAADAELTRLREENGRLREENKQLRFYLWLKHGDHNHILYGDDGQQMCNSCLIDFKRDPIESIVAKFKEQALRRAGIEGE